MKVTMITNRHFLNCVRKSFLVTAVALFLFSNAFVVVAHSTKTSSNIITTNSGSSTDKSPSRAFVRNAAADHVSSNDASVLNTMPSLTCIRGGSDISDTEETEEDESEDEYQDDDSEQNGTSQFLVQTGSKALKVVGNASIQLFKALHRAIEAGLHSPMGNENEEQNDDEEEEEETSAVVKIMSTLQRMWHAMLHDPTQDSPEMDDTAGEQNTEESKTTNKKSKQAANTDNFGSYLNREYHCNYSEETISSNATTVIHGGSLSDALREARSKARLLVVYIPSARPTNKKKRSVDTVCAESLLSKDAAEAVESKRGSYVVWSVTAGSSEAVKAMKRLRATKKKGIPLLLVAYPAQVMDGTGKAKLTPKLLAQHHCNPPPSPKSLSAWLKALRKRHAKQVSTMKNELKEYKLYMERKEGYSSSIKSDLEREHTEAKERAEREAEEAAERQKLKEMEERRSEFMSSLPEEPAANGPNVITVALRFPDGKRGQRRFDNGVDMMYVFNWVDGEFSVEREKVTLSTMNGSMSFTFEEHQQVSLKDAGLGKMCGLRVIPMKEEDEETAEDVTSEETKQE